MLRTRLQQGLKSVIPSLSAYPSTSSSLFHTSVQTQAVKRRDARSVRKGNTETRAQRQRTLEYEKPHPVLGHKPGDETKWLNSDLCNILVKQNELQAWDKPPPPPLDTTQPLQLRENMQWGITGDPEAQHLLFDALPNVSAQHNLLHLDVVNPQDPLIEKKIYEGQWAEMHKAHMLMRLVDLQNASATGIAFENRRRCVEAFSAPGKPNDTGRPEVQAALLTMKIRKLYEHLLQNKKDISNRRSIRILVHQRAKMLKYLKRLDRARFEAVMPRLGLEESAIDGELIVF